MPKRLHLKTDTKAGTVLRSGINHSDIEKLVDRGAELNQLIKESGKEFDKIKETLKTHAKENGLGRIKGNTASCTISEYVQTIQGSVTEFARLLKRIGKLEIFDAVTAIKVTEAKKYLDEDVLDYVLKKKTTEYGKISFRKNKK